MLPTHQSISHNLAEAKPFLNFLSSLVPLPEQMKRDIAVKVLLSSISKGDILPVGFLKSNMVFLAQGAVRGFIMVDARDITLTISLENNVLGSPNSEIFTRGEYPLSLQAMEDCQLIMMPYSLLPYLRTTYPSMSAIGEILTGRYYHVASERGLISRLPSAKLRYSRLMITDPELFKRIPLKYLASYLAMRNETLSRLRTKAKAATVDIGAGHEPQPFD